MDTRLRQVAVAAIAAMLGAAAWGPLPPVHAAVAEVVESTGDISGTVSGPSGELLEDFPVSVYRVDGTTYEYVGMRNTLAEGRYYFFGLPAGGYRIQFGEQFHDSWPTDHATEWYPDSTTLQQAEDVQVQPGQSVTVDGELALDGEIAGLVTAGGGVSPERTAVFAYRLVGDEWVQVSEAYANGSGQYLLDGLSAGTYRVGFQHFTEGWEYWEDKGLIANASDVEVGQSTLSGIDAYVIEGEHDGEQPPPPPVPTPPVVTPPVVTPPVVTPPAPVVDVPTALAKALAAIEVTGKPKVGKTVKVVGLDLDLRTAVTYRFQWFAGTRKIAKATRAKLKVTRAMRGKKLSAKVTATAASTSRSVKLKVGKVA